MRFLVERKRYYERWLKNLYPDGIIYSYKQKDRIVMVMYMIFNPSDFTCKYLRFIVFDFTDCKIIYSGTYKLLEWVHQFNVYTLLDLAKLSLRELTYEEKPFKYHIVIMQSIINSFKGDPYEQRDLSHEPEDTVGIEPHYPMDMFELEPPKPPKPQPAPPKPEFAAMEGR